MRNKKIIEVCGKEMKVGGRFVRIARLEGEKHTFPDDPEAVVHGLRRSRMQADIFTFLQKVSDTSPKYKYSFEYDNLAVLPISTFEHWWNHQIRSYPRNRARQAEKKVLHFAKCHSLRLSFGGFVASITKPQCARASLFLTTE